MKKSRHRRPVVSIKPAKHPWRLWVVLLLLLVGGLLLVPAVHWPVYGWLRGEAFYQGMPTSYWHSQISTPYKEPSWAGRLLEQVGGTRTHIGFYRNLMVPSELLNNDPADILVLKELLHSDDIKSKVIAATLLRKQLGGEETELIKPVLLEGATSDDTDVRNAALETLKAIDPEGAAKGKYK